MSFLKTLKTDPSVRKLFGKRELKIIEKQLLGINLTQSEKNRLSRDIRKKFETIQTLSRYNTEFKLKKGAEIQKKIDTAKEVLQEDPWFPRIEKIILFGSAVENKLTFHSDIDLAVLFKNINLKEATHFRKRLLGNLPENIDIQIYNTLPQNLQQEIDQKGRVLWSKELKKK